MFEDILDFLYSNRFIELFDWTKKVSFQNINLLPSSYIRFLSFLYEGKIDDAISLIEELSAVEFENEKLMMCLKVLKEKRQKLMEISQFANRFDKEKPFINIVLEKYILVGQTSERNSNRMIDSIANLKELALNPNLCYYNGNFIEFKGISSIDRLSAIVNDEEFSSQMENIAKYEKVFIFISKINEKMQRYFSENKIGIIVYNQELYLIKFIPMFSLDTEIRTSQEKKVNLLDKNFGTIIGILINSDLSFGDMVVFQEESSMSGDINLRPLISFDISLFKSANKKNSGFKLDTDKDINEFIDAVKDWMDFGIQLLGSNKRIDLKNRQDLYVYTKLELQKIENETNLNVKISRLSQLLTFGQEPELESAIKNKLENAFLLYFRECASKKIPIKLNEFINRMIKLKLFQSESSFSLFINLYSFLIEKYSFDPKDIINSIKLLDSNWRLKDDHYKIIEKIHLNALATIIQPLIVSDKIKDILKIIENYTPKTRFMQTKIDLLILDIVYHIYRNTKKSDGEVHISNTDFIMFLSNLALYYDKTYPSISLDSYLKQTNLNHGCLDLDALQQKLTSLFDLMISQYDFLIFLGNQTIDAFLEFIDGFPSRLLKPQAKDNFLVQILKIAPLIIIKNNEHEFGKKLIDYLIKKNKERLFIRFITYFVESINKTSTDIIQNSDFLNSINSMFHNIILELDNNFKINENYLIPYTTEIRALLNNWYKKGNLPKGDYGLHKSILQKLTKYVEKTSDVQWMYYMITIKDLLENYLENWNSLDNKFSSFVPKLIEEKKARNLFLYEAYKYIEMNVVNDVLIMQKIINTFNLILKYRNDINIEDEIIDNFIKIFNKQIEKALIYYIEQQEEQSIKTIFGKIKNIKEIISISVFESIFKKLLEKIDFDEEQLGYVEIIMEFIIQALNLISSINFEKSEFFKFSHFITLPLITDEPKKHQLIHEFKQEFETQFEMFFQKLILAATSYHFSESLSTQTKQSFPEHLTNIFLNYFLIVLFNLDFSVIGNQIKEKIGMLFFHFQNNRIHIQSKTILIDLLLKIVNTYHFYDLYDEINNYYNICSKLELLYNDLKNKTSHGSSNRHRFDDNIDSDIEILLNSKENHQNDFFYQYILGLYFFQDKKYEMAENYLQRAFKLDCPESIKMKKYVNYIRLLHRLNKKQEYMKIYIEAPSDIKENPDFKEYMAQIGLGSS